MKEHKFGEQLKYSRKKAGLTQKQLGEMAGVGQVVVANYERGARFPGEETLRKLAEALNVSLDTLLSISLSEATVENNRNYYINKLLELLLNQTVSACWEYTKAWKRAENLDTEEVYSEILIPLLHKTGDLWFSGEISIIDEHLISGKVREIITLAAADDRRWGQTSDLGRKWMGLCAPGEKHDIALLMTSRLLQLKGWNTRFAGVDMPVDDLIKSVNTYRPHIISFSVTIDSNLQGLETYLRVLHEKREYDFALILGGSAAGLGGIGQISQYQIVVNSIRQGIEEAEKYITHRSMA